MNMIASKLGASPSIAETRGIATDQPVERVPMLRRYLRITLRRRWVILGAIAACVALGLIATILMAPKYTARATIEISRDSDQVTNFQGVEKETSVADQEFYQTQYGLLQARTLAERVALQLRLVDDPKFFESFGASSDDAAFALSSGHYGAAGRARRQRVAGELLLKHLSVDPARLSRLVVIGFTSHDPALSARVANAWAENFIETNLERKVQATSYGRDQLQHQLADYKERLDASQRQLVAYASQQQIINLPGQTNGNGSSTQERSITADTLAALNTALTQATADRIQAEARYRQSGGAASTEALSNQAINTLRAQRAELSAEYAQLLVRFEPTYPAAQAIKAQLDQLDRSIGREEGRVSGSVQSDYRQALAREHSLATQVARLKASYLDLRRRSIQYNIYQQEVDTNRALYDGLLQRFKEIGVAGGVGINNIAIVDPADVPQLPSSPNIKLNLLLATVAGLLIGAALALGLEQLDEAVADPSDVERRLGLPLLGTVPKVVHEAPKEALLDPKSDLFDAYMAVQTNLSFTTEHGVPRSFAVTSTRPAEGKSTTAFALASTLARAHRKVILVDGDMRSPSIHRLSGVDHEKGLSNFLAGEEAVDGLVFHMRDLGFSGMSAGPIPPNAAELLTGSRLGLLLDRLLQTFDHVIIDSPPVMGLADAPLIAGRVEGVIYAVESHGIGSSSVKTALGRLVSAHAHVIGVVLTKFEARRGHYGSGYEYGYNYGRSDGDAKVA